MGSDKLTTQSSYPHHNYQKKKKTRSQITYNNQENASSFTYGSNANIKKKSSLKQYNTNL